MKTQFQKFFADEVYDESKSYLLSQELEFEHAKSILTFALAFIGGIVTLKTAVGVDNPLNEGFLLSIGAASVSAILSFNAQQGIIKDLRIKRGPSKFRRLLRVMPPSMALGVAFAGAYEYFDFAF